MATSKPCTRCKKVKPLSEFNKRAASKDGHRPECRECQSKNHWHKKYPEKNRAASLRWRNNNKEKANEATRKWREKNYEKEKLTKRKTYYEQLGREVPDEIQIPQGPTQLYVIRDWNGTPIYVGICQEGGFESRMKQHRRSQPWGNVIPWQPTVEKTLPTREEAFAAERTRILWYERRGIELFNRADNPFFSKERYVDLFWKLLGQAQNQPDTQT